MTREPLGIEAQDHEGEPVVGKFQGVLGRTDGKVKKGVSGSRHVVYSEASLLHLAPLLGAFHWNEGSKVQ